MKGGKGGTVTFLSQKTSSHSKVLLSSHLGLALTCMHQKKEHLDSFLSTSSFFTLWLIFYRLDKGIKQQEYLDPSFKIGFSACPALRINLNMERFSCMCVFLCVYCISVPTYATE